MQLSWFVASVILLRFQLWCYCLKCSSLLLYATSRRAEWCIKCMWCEISSASNSRVNASSWKSFRRLVWIKVQLTHIVLMLLLSNYLWKIRPATDMRLRWGTPHICFLCIDFCSNTRRFVQALSINSTADVISSKTGLDFQTFDLDFKSLPLVSTTKSSSGSTRGFENCLVLVSVFGNCLCSTILHAWGLLFLFTNLA